MLYLSTIRNSIVLLMVRKSEIDLNTSMLTIKGE
jgi:hypothetical protein